MIPAKLHQIWFGPRPVPEEWIAAWRAMHPTWEYRLWREADIAGLPMANQPAYDYYRGKGNWVGMSDIARMAILREHGGVYVDVDSKPLRTFDKAPFMDADFFAAYEPVASLPGRVAAGCIGAVRDHPIFKTLAHLVSEMPDIDEVWDTTGGTGLTAAILAHRQCCKPLVLPSRTFYATTANGRPTPGREVAYSEHFWATTNAAYPIRAVILVPRRAGDPVRDRIWEYVERHWRATGLPIHEGHHDEGLFNASAARNAAARLAGDWDVAVFVDADTIMLEHAPVQRGITLAAQSGQMVRPYTRYWFQDEAATEAMIATSARPRRGSRLIRERAHGGVNIVPRRLWDAVGGYDERFVGWGSEDNAFELACTALGGFRQIQGDVYHLAHPKQPRDESTPQYQANVALRLRYESTRRPAAMRALLAERSGGEPAALAVGAVVTTDGRRDAIAVTIPSLEAKVGPFAERLICDDSGDPAYAAWLTETFPAWTVKAHPRLTHGPAIAFAISEAAKLDVDWVFWSEDDIEYLERLDLLAMASVMESTPHLKQMVVKRQAWFPAEVEAGGMIERFDPALFTEHAQNGTSWIEHRQFYSLNPHLVQRALLKAIRWPPVPNSEHHFSRRLFRDPRPSVGLWGMKADAPLVRHFGERVGIGY